VRIVENGEDESVQLLVSPEEYSQITKWSLDPVLHADRSKPIAEFERLIGSPMYERIREYSNERRQVNIVIEKKRDPELDARQSMYNEMFRVNATLLVSAALARGGVRAIVWARATLQALEQDDFEWVVRQMNPYEIAGQSILTTEERLEPFRWLVDFYKTAMGDRPSRVLDANQFAYEYSVFRRQLSTLLHGE
jgi:hypothetical protein